MCVKMPVINSLITFLFSLSPYLSLPLYDMNWLFYRNEIFETLVKGATFNSLTIYFCSLVFLYLPQNLDDDIRDGRMQAVHEQTESVIRFWNAVVMRIYGLWFNEYLIRWGLDVLYCTVLCCAVLCYIALAVVAHPVQWHKIWPNFSGKWMDCG